MRPINVSLACIMLGGCAASHAIDPQLAASSVNFADSERVEVSLANFSFTPTTLNLKAGRPYTLVLTNAASGGHDFTAPEFFAAARISPADADQVRSGNVELDGGDTATIHLVPGAGNFDLVCTHLGHAALGMKGSIKVS